jgi:hypothetical protein
VSKFGNVVSVGPAVNLVHRRVAWKYLCAESLCLVLCGWWNEGLASGWKEGRDGSPLVKVWVAVRVAVRESGVAGVCGVVIQHCLLSALVVCFAGLL